MRVLGPGSQKQKRTLRTRRTLPGPLLTCLKQEAALWHPKQEVLQALREWACPESSLPFHLHMPGSACLWLETWLLEFWPRAQSPFSVWWLIWAIILSTPSPSFSRLSTSMVPHITWCPDPSPSACVHWTSLMPTESYHNHNREWIPDSPVVRICLPMQGTWVQSRLGKILHAMGQLSLCTTTTEARAPQEKPPNEKP